MIYKNETDEARDLLRKVQTYWEEGVAAMKHRRAKWKNNYAWWVNMKLSGQRPTYKSDIRINYCFVTTQTKIPIITQNQPTVNFVPYNPDDEESARTLSKLVGNALWNKLEIQDTFQDVAWNSCVYDNGFYKIGWDPDEDEMFVKSIEPFKLIPDPMADKIDSCRYIFHVEPYAVSHLKVLYPDFADKIKADPAISSVLFEERRSADRKATSQAISTDTEYAIERAYKKEAWLTEAAFLAEVEESYDEAGKKKKRKRNKYPNGLLVTMINDDLIVDVKENPNPWKFPFVKSAMNKVGNEFWDMGDIEQVIPLQQGLNHITQQLADIVNKVANVGWTVHPNVGEENIRKLAQALQKPGALKPIAPEYLKADDPPQVPAILVRMQQEYIQRIFDVTGISDILQGSGRVTHRTARGIERLYEAGASRIGQSVRNHENALKKVFLMMGDLAIKFYKEERFYPLLGGQGTLEGILQIPDGALSGKFEASIDSGATLPQDKKARAELALELFTGGVLEMAAAGDPAHKEIARMVLQAVEFPGRERLLAVPTAPPETPPLQQPPAGPGESLPPEVEQMAAAAGVSPEELLMMISGQPQGAAGVPNVG